MSVAEMVGKDQGFIALMEKESICTHCSSLHYSPAAFGCL